MSELSDRIHITETKEGYRGLAAEVSAVAHGGKVLLFAKEDRAGEDAVAALSLSATPILRQKIPEEGAVDLLLRKEYPDSLLAVVGVGGNAEMQAAKCVRLGRTVPRILFPTDLSGLSALEERAFFCTKGDILTLRSEGHTVLLDASLPSSGVREGLGWLLARFTEIADDGYRRLIEEGKSPGEVLSLLRDCCSRLKEIREENAAETILRSALRLEDSIRSKGLCASDSVHLLACLLEKRIGGSYFEHLFLAAYSLLKLYAQYLGDLPLEYCVPPDRTKNADLLRSMCGMTGISFGDAPCYAEGYEERYRTTAEYREDFAECFSEKTLPLSSLCRIYRRNRVKEEAKPPTAEELLALLSLTGEIVSGYPLIKHIKMTGIVEPLLLCG